MQVFWQKALRSVTFRRGSSKLAGSFLLSRKTRKTLAPGAGGRGTRAEYRGNIILRFWSGGETILEALESEIDLLHPFNVSAFIRVMDFAER